MEEVEILEIEFTDNEVEMVDLEVKDNHNFFLDNNILSLNSGKTFFIRSIMDRLKMIDKSIILISDVKNELYSSKHPVQEQFRNHLPGEEPKGMKIVALRPTFFKQFYPDLPKENYWYSIKVSDMAKADFMTLINAKSMTVNQQIALEVLYELLEKSLKKDKELKFSVEMIEGLLEQIDELTPAQKQLLAWKFRPLKNSYFYEEKWERSIIELLNKEYAITINMENFDTYSKDGGLQLPEVVLNFVLREVILGRRAGKVKRPVWVILDEASRFISNDKQNSLKNLLLESYDMDSRYGISYITATQFVKDMPEKVLSQSKYLFIPHSADVDTVKSLLINSGIARNQQYALNQSIYLKNKMKKHPYSWAVINRHTNEREIILPLSPLSFHLQTTE